MSLVYVVHAPKPRRNAGGPPNLSGATQFGHLTPIFDSGDWPSMFPDAAQKQIVERMKDFKVDEDYILWCGGDPIALVLLGAYLYSEGLDANWLRSSRKLNDEGERTTEYEYQAKELVLGFPSDDQHAGDLVTEGVGQ